MTRRYRFAVQRTPPARRLPCPARGSLAPMSTVIDHYAVLGVSRGASAEEIRTAYRRAARASHPDLHPEDPTAPERFKQVQVAYEILGDPGRRAAYDTPVRQAGPRRAPAYDPDEPVSLAREL